MDQYSLNEKITIGIVLYKEDYNVIYKTLDKIRSFKIIIIDNSFDLKLKKKIEDTFKIEKYILNKKNLGFSTGYNQSVKLCKTDYFLILNPDCIIKEKSILKLYDKMENDKNCFLTTATSYDKENKLKYTGGLLPENGDKKIPLNLKGDACVENTLGSCMLVRKKDFIDIGLFDEKFFLYFSDDELCRRIKKKKKSVIQVFEAKAIHSHGELKVKNKLKGTFIRNFHFTFDELYYYYKNNDHYEKYKIIKKKLPKYLFKVFLNFFFLRFEKGIYYLAKILAIMKFNKLIN